MCAFCRIQRDKDFATKKAERANLRVALRDKYRLPDVRNSSYYISINYIFSCINLYIYQFIVPFFQVYLIYQCYFTFIIIYYFDLLIIFIIFITVLLFLIFIKSFVLLLRAFYVCAAV